MNPYLTHVKVASGKRRLPVRHADGFDRWRTSNRRQLADSEMITRAYLRFYRIVVGKLPSITGWQPALPNPKKRAE